MAYNDFVRTYRALVQGSSATHLKAMRFLLAAEEKPHLWEGGPHKTFHSLLTKEKLCTWRLFTNFRAASKILKTATVNLLGVYGSAQFATLAPALRPKVLKAVSGWVRKNRISPTYQTVSEIIKHFAPRPKKATRASVPALLRRVAGLESTIVRLETELKEARRGNRANNQVTGRRTESNPLPHPHAVRQGHTHRNAPRNAARRGASRSVSAR